MLYITSYSVSTPHITERDWCRHHVLLSYFVSTLHIIFIISADTNKCIFCGTASWISRHELGWLQVRVGILVHEWKFKTADKVSELTGALGNDNGRSTYDPDICPYAKTSA